MTAATRLDRSLPLTDRVRYRAHRIDALGSSHSNMARALAKDALRLLDEYETLLRYARPVDIEAARRRHGE